MTKPLGSPKSQDQQDSHRTFYGHPIVVRVKDLSWQPPVEEAPPAEEEWVSNLLGEDPYEADGEESLLMDVPPAPELPPVEESVAELPRLPITPTESKPQPASKTPTYLSHSSEGRRERLQSLITGQWKNRIMMGGLALSLFFATYWLLSTDGADDPPVDDVHQDLFVETGQLGDAPAWDASSNMVENDVTTIEPASMNSTRMASMPPRDNIVGSPANPSSKMELTAISAPDVDSPSQPSGGNGNPAWSQNPASTTIEPQDDYAPSFGPAGGSSSIPGSGSPSFDSSSVPMGSPIPNFDNASGSSQDNYQPSFQGNRPSYEETAPAYQAPSAPTGGSQYTNPSSGNNNASHWMKTDNPSRSMPGNTPGGNSGFTQSQLPSIQNGPPQDAGLPQIEAATPYNASKFANSPNNQQPTPQDGYGFSFNPNGSTPESSTPSQDGIRAARLSGEIDTRFDSGIR